MNLKGNKYMFSIRLVLKAMKTWMEHIKFIITVECLLCEEEMQMRWTSSISGEYIIHSTLSRIETCLNF